MDTDTMQALRDVIEYLRDDEQMSFEEENEPEEHIYRSLMTLEKYLDA